MTQSSTFVAQGPGALSAFRAARLLASIHAIEKSAASISGRFIHFINVSRPLEATERVRLDALLDYGNGGEIDTAGAQFLVVPRLGTISPWASKATDIAHNTGLAAVRRIERGTQYAIGLGRKTLRPDAAARIASVLHDRMTESVIDPLTDPALLFRELDGKPMQTIPVIAHGRDALQRANIKMGLALSRDEVDYLLDAFMGMRRDPTDVELMMFAQANSEHCRHKIFNATWTIDGAQKDATLFDMIRATHRAAPRGTVVAYSDNSAVLEGRTAQRFYPHSDRPAGAVGIDYGVRDELTHTVFKVETHNHPTAISP
ncbi:MAG TPA: phosphoribosylformylglycinamidine synthase, partial [Burkholderiaceae bacterium]|nr:phosphoribosylformylglycinamidine synthase [Burkholderiaceae bacterium]